VASILPFIKSSNGVFDHRATRVMGGTFDAAYKKLYCAKQPQDVYIILAARIIAATQKGERDLVRLHNTGLVWFDGEMN
jgi:hypothetical protein